MRGLPVIRAVALAALLLVGLPARASDQALMVIANAKAGVTSLTRDELESIFSLSRRNWPNGSRILVMNLESGTPARASFDRAVLGMTPEQVARFWVDHRIRGGGEAPRRVPSAALMLKVVSVLPGSIGYVPEGPLAPGMHRVARVVNGSVVPER